MTTDVFDSPAVGILVELETAGLEVVERDGEVYVRPATLLTPEQLAVLKQERAAIVALLRVCDAGVVQRREVFEQLIASRSDVLLPALLFRPGTPYTRQRCYSCADPIPSAWGRCWRCALAARLAARLPIPVESVAAYDGARVVA